MACYLTAPSHYMSQCQVLWHLPEDNLTRHAHDSYPRCEFDIYQFKITAVSHSDQWVTYWQQNSYNAKRKKAIKTINEPKLPHVNPVWGGYQRSRLGCQSRWINLKIIIQWSNLVYIAMETVTALLHSLYEGHQVEPRKWLATARKWMSKTVLST